LAVLFRQLADSGCETEAYRFLVRLTPYGVTMRYDRLPPDAKPLDREKIIDEIRSLINHVTVLVEQAEE